MKKKYIEMKKFNLTLLVGVMAYFLCVGTAFGDGHATVKGGVTDENTGQPISGAVVTIFSNPFGEPIASGMTNHMGRYIIECQVNGNECQGDSECQGNDSIAYYYASCYAEGYESEWWQDASSPEEADSFMVQVNQITQGIDFTLTSGGILSGIKGTVIDQSTYELIEEARVTALLQDSIPAGFAYTNDKGDYTIILPPGEYYLCAQKEEYKPEWYYEGSHQPVQVNEGEFTVGINFTLEPISTVGWATVKGGVTDENTGQPISGAVVTIFNNPFGEPIASGMTNHMGRYIIECQVNGNECQGSDSIAYYYASCYAEGYESEWWQDASSPEEADSFMVQVNQITQGIDFTLTSGGILSGIKGTVIDQSTYELIEEARVTALLQDSIPAGFAYTNDKGDYTIILPPGEYYLCAQKEEYKPEWYYEGSHQPVQVNEGEFTVGINFTLESAPITEWATVKGRVTDENAGQPILGAIVTIFNNPFGEPIASGMTNHMGRYVIECQVNDNECQGDSECQGNDSIVYYYASCYAEGYESEWWQDASSPEEADSFMVQINQITEGIDFALTSGGILSGIKGTVIDQNTYEPIEGTYITALLYDSIPAGFAETDSEGNYTIILPAGEYYLHAQKEEYKPEWYYEGSHQPVQVNEGEFTVGINFTLEPLPITGAISGMVMTEAGAPIQFAWVSLYTDPNNDPIDLTLTNCHGFYRFERVEPGEYYLFAEAPGFVSEWYDGTTSPDNAIPVTVYENGQTASINFYLATKGEMGSIAGTVKDKNTDDPITGAYILVNSLQDSITGSAYTDQNGFYIIEGLTPGEYEVQAFASGYEPSETTVVVNPDTSTEVNFALAPTVTEFGAISGLVTDTLGNPISYAFVGVFVDSIILVNGNITNEYGEYIVANLPVGTYYVLAMAEGYTDEWYNDASNFAYATACTVTANDTTTGVDFTLTPKAKGIITGTVTSDATGEPIPDAIVHAFSRDAFEVGISLTDSLGEYELLLEPGLYIVSAYAEGYISEDYPEPLEVIADSIISGIDFALTPYPQREGYISGIVVDDSTNKPIAQAMVVAMSDSTVSNVPFFGYAITDTNGAYTIENIPEVDSAYYVLAFALGYVSEFYDNVYNWEEATLVSAPVDSINFALSRASSGPIAIAGRITGEGVGISNALVYAVDGERIISSARTLSDGSYAIVGLAPGTYTLEATAVRYYSTSYGPVSAVKDVSGVDIALTSVTGVEESQPNVLTHPLLLLAVNPNPTTSKVIISYELPKSEAIDLTIYDISGRRIVTLIRGIETPGAKAVNWNTKNVPQGIYFVRLASASTTIVRKLVILR